MPKITKKSLVSFFSIIAFLILAMPQTGRATLVGNTTYATFGFTNGVSTPLETGVYRVGPSIPIDVYINTRGQSIDAVAAYINYSTSLFAVDSIDYSGSVFPIQWESSTTSPAGTIKIGRSISGSSINSTNAKIATIMLRGLSDTTPASDNFTFDFATGDSNRSAAFLAGTFLLSGVYNARISLDGTAPANVSSFAATAGDSQITLTWTNPTSDFAGVKILRKLGSFPANPTDGTQVYDSNGTSYIDTGLSNGITYYYRAFSRDVVLNYSSGASISAAPRDLTAPAAITNLSATALTATSIRLNWTAVGDDGSIGTAASYDVRYSTVTITAANFSSANQAGGMPVPQTNGSSETATVSGLTGNTTYYFAIKAVDDGTNAGAISNIPNARTFRTADLNYNGYVNMQDASIMMSYWGNTSRPSADLNQDGYVNMQDASLMMSQWG